MSNHFTDLCKSFGLDEEMTSNAWADLRLTSYSPDDPETIRIVLRHVMRAECRQVGHDLSQLSEAIKADSLSTVEQVREILRENAGGHGEEYRALMSGLRGLLDELGQRISDAERTHETAIQAVTVHTAEQSSILADNIAQGVGKRLEDTANEVLEKVDTTTEKAVNGISLTLDEVRGEVATVCADYKTSLDTMAAVHVSHLRKRELAKVGLMAGAAMLVSGGIGAIAMNVHDDSRLDAEASSRWSVPLTQADATKWQSIMAYNPDISTTIQSYCRTGTTAVRHVGGRLVCSLPLAFEPAPAPSSQPLAVATDTLQDLVAALTGWLRGFSPWALLVGGLMIGPLLRWLTATWLWRFITGATAPMPEVRK